MGKDHFTISVNQDIMDRENKFWDNSIRGKMGILPTESQNSGSSSKF